MFLVNFLPNFLLALREGVEASLIIGILVAYVVKAGRKDLLPKVWLGVLAAALIPLALGAYLTWGSYSLTFQAQETLGGCLSLLAVALITWMIMWMGRNARDFTANLKKSTENALNSSHSGVAIIWLAVITVGREGLETALFVWATVKSSAETSVFGPALGVIVGLICAILIGYLVYLGSARINLRRFFNWTGYLLIFVAAGIVLYGIGDLQEAGVLPGHGTSLFDFSYLLDGSYSSLLSVNTVWFTLLKAIFNVNLAPSMLQFIGYTVYLVVTLLVFTFKVVKADPAPCTSRQESAALKASDAAADEKSGTNMLSTDGTTLSADKSPLALQ